MKDLLLTAPLLLATTLFFVWCIWTTNSKHPERLKRLREKLGVNVDDAE